MITFLVCLALLVTAYFTYGRYLERLVGIDPLPKAPKAPAAPAANKES